VFKRRARQSTDCLARGSLDSRRDRPLVAYAVEKVP
jgi:hypothetical protein